MLQSISSSVIRHCESSSTHDNARGSAGLRPADQPADAGSPAPTKAVASYPWSSLNDTAGRGICWPAHDVEQSIRRSAGHRPCAQRYPLPGVGLGADDPAHPRPRRLLGSRSRKPSPLALASAGASGDARRQRPSVLVPTYLGMVSCRRAAVGGEPMTARTPERVGIAEAVLITGMSRRTLQDLAPSIPGASKPAGRWLFAVAELRAWVTRTTKRPACRKTSTFAPASIGRVSRSGAKNIAKAYELVLNGSR